MTPPCDVPAARRPAQPFHTRATSQRPTSRRIGSGTSHPANSSNNRRLSIESKHALMSASTTQPAPARRARRTASAAVAVVRPGRKP